jgi:hypothetical protein
VKSRLPIISSCRNIKNHRELSSMRQIEPSDDGNFVIIEVKWSGFPWTWKRGLCRLQEEVVGSEIGWDGARRAPSNNHHMTIVITTTRLKVPDRADASYLEWSSARPSGGNGGSVK